MIITEIITYWFKKKLVEKNEKTFWKNPIFLVNCDLVNLFGSWTSNKI